MLGSTSHDARCPLWRPTRRKVFIVALFAALCAAFVAAAQGAPSSATDETKVPHYFGPYPNWANSPLTKPDASVTITVAAGCPGSGAAADATVGANGAVTGISLTAAGNDYAGNGRCLPVVSISGAGSGATAKPTVTKSGAVVAVALDTLGSHYIKPAVSFSGGGGSGAAATAFGSVDRVTVTDGGSGYTAPTVAFDLPDSADGEQATGHADINSNGTITSVTVDNPGSGYSAAPGVAVLNGTQFDPVALKDGGSLATATSSLSLASITMDAFGANYQSAPKVTITDSAPNGGSGATAHSTIDAGAITAITVTKPGSGYVTPGGIKKFQDTLPGLGEAGKNNLGQYIPVAKPDTKTFPNADYYVIAVVQHRERMSSSLPATGTLLREYVQLSTAEVPGKHVPLTTDLKGGGTAPVLMPDGSQAYGVDDPHYLGPTIVASRGRATRVVFYDLLPKGGEGDLFLPVDTTVMGSGEGNMADGYDPTPTSGGTVLDGARNPMCGEQPKMHEHCFTDNRATLHLHGGNTPWISDGTPHQWITPANENTPWPQGVSVKEVPDMVGASKPAGVPDCSDPKDGCQTFYYTNQQSARLMFYHDHSWGITRLNVYGGAAAGYVITDPVEQKLFGPNGTYPDMGEGLPLIIQDKTFVPSAKQLAEQDPTWDSARWGGEGNLWYHHVYMPAQNPADPSGMSSFGRWMYGPWFFPPQKDAKNGPIDNPYYDPGCDPNVKDFCEPPKIPGTPNISAGMEQFNDTPIVNGTAYPTTTLSPKAYRMRLLNAANDRFLNLQWYVADSTGTEVALKPAEVAAAQTDPTVSPTPDTAKSPAGPSWIQVGTDGGFLPAPAVVPNQPTTWITDPTRFDFGNVDKHAMLLAPAERADAVVDFSKYAGKTLILYNDAPAAFPARVPCYDYYTGGPDMTPACAPSTLPGYGPNTRTIMQVKIAANGAAKAFDVTALQSAFKHKADGSGVFEKDQHPIVVGQAAYNSAYGTSFAASGNCTDPAGTNKCDGFLRIDQTGGEPFRFDTLRGQQQKVTIEAKAIHDEMNATTFDEYGRMTANLGLEASPPTPGLTNVNLMPYAFPTTELIDATDLPKGDVNVTPIASGKDGTQIWRITHNGVDTHPIHFHAFDIQLINRVTWDNIIIPPDPNELGWKDTVRVSPLEDTIIALRPVIPTLPFEVPNSVRKLNPMMPLFNGADPLNPQQGDQGVLGSATLADALGVGIPPSNGAGEPVDIVNHLVNFGSEYVYHCHILSHEEMDMMRPVSIAMPPRAPASVAYDNATGKVSWTDQSIAETAFAVQKSTDGGQTWSEVGRVERKLEDPNTTGATESVDVGAGLTGVQLRVVAENTVGDTFNYSNPGTNEIPTFPGDTGFPHVTATAKSAVVTVA